MHRAELDTFATTHRARFEEDLRRWVEIPSISADPTRRPELERMAELACETLRGFGATAELLDTGGPPIVLGTLPGASGAPTITVYNHLDVQPANEPEWRSEPFRLQIEGERYTGRGATDDKGPALTALYGAVAAKAQGSSTNVRFLWELEEESGSTHFRAGLERFRDRLASTHAIVVSDTIWLTRGKPSTPAGLRGLQGFSLHLETADHDLHSGLVGGAARNPLSELAWLVGEMLDAPSGRVKIPGFYDEVEPLSDREAASFASSGFTTERFKSDHALSALRSEDPLEIMRRVWAEPTMEVHGFVGGYTGPGIKSAVPARAEVKLSCRMVPRMRGARVLERVEAFVKERIPDVRLVKESALEPYRGLSDGPRAAAIAEAYRFGFGVPPAFTREGASIGAVPTMAELLGRPVLFLGLSLPEHGYHAPNEHYDWQQAAGGMAAFARYFELGGALAG